MRNYLRLLFIISIFLFINNTNTLSTTTAKQIPDPIVISTFEGDLTGNSQYETIQLKGNLLKRQGNYYQNLWIEVMNIHSKKWKIPFTGGYDPKVQLVDLNHDQVNDLFYKFTKNKSEKLNFHHLYSFKNGSFQEIPLPEHSYMKGSFSNYFQIEIQLSIQNNKPLIINAEDRAKEYIKLGLYDTQGTLVQPTSIIIAPISLYEPTVISESKGYGLKSYQQVSGANYEDVLGTIETLWYYENGAWIILNTNWFPT